MDEKLAYLLKYKKNVKIITKIEAQNLTDKLPYEWLELIFEDDINKKIKIAMNIWDQNLMPELSNTISYLREYLEYVDLMEINGRFSLLYTIENTSGKMYYEGRNPLDVFNNDMLESAWNKIPHKIRVFYEKVHDGFYYFAGESMGIVPRESVTFLDDYEWGILDDIEKPLLIDLKSSFGFFSNGAGTYVTVDCSNCENGNAALWSAKVKPVYNVNFWDVVDEWIVLGFEN